MIDQAHVDGLQLVVDLAASDDVDQINVIDPSGELFAKQSVAAGVQKVTFDLGTSYSPGEFRVLALNEDKTVGQTTLTIQPEWQITEFGIGANHPNEMPEGLGNIAEGAAFLTVQNNGTGPDAIRKLLVLGDVPNPTTELRGADSGSETGIWLPDEKTVFDELLFKPRTTRRLYTDRAPFTFFRDGNITCQSTPQSGTFEVILKTSVGGREAESYTIEYSAADEYDQCSITVQEAE